MDWAGIQEVGLPTFVTVLILGLCVWLVKNVFTMFQESHKSQQLERATWMASYEKYAEKIDRAMQYNREEHLEMMDLLKSWKK